jgi:hypothetical protein
MPHIARCPKAVEGCGERASGFDASVTHPIGYHDSGTLLRGCLGLGPDTAGALRQDCGDCGLRVLYNDNDVHGLLSHSRI